jgi:uncharacterized membrane protein
MHEPKQTGRLEAFSDGVFAIAITLLVLEIKVPGELPEGAHLSEALGQQWPSYLAFVTSFATIGIMWLNHHRMFSYITRVDHTLLLLNGLLLLGITFVPFPTALLAEYIQHPDQQVAAAVYSGTFVGLALVFNLLWGYATHQARLLDPSVDQEMVRKITRQYRFGPPLYLVAFALAWVNAAVSLGLNLLLALFFTIPDLDQLAWPGNRKAAP